LDDNIELQKPIIPDNPKALYESKQIDIKQMPVYTNIQDLVPMTTVKQSTIIERPVKRLIVYKYVTINGFDRDWITQKKRCNYSVNFNSFNDTYKNIASIKVNRLIIPNEIIESRNIMNTPKFVYHHDHKLAYPYLLLQIEEVSGMCDGLNSQVQKSFAMFIYEDSYKCPNGRGYIIMKPCQDEIKLYTSHSTNIQRLTFSITKPSGALFNTNMDNYNVFKIEYEQYNNVYIKIVLDKFFDKNEFYIGDTVFIRNFVMYQPASASTNTSSGDYAAMMAFVNRPEGHEILQTGDANDNGFYKSFYAFGPNKMDQVNGKLVIEACQVEALREYNRLVAPQINGSIINISLQNVINCTIGLDMADNNS
jgi:hypothetical protein